MKELICDFNNLAVEYRAPVEAQGHLQFVKVDIYSDIFHTFFSNNDNQI